MLPAVSHDVDVRNNMSLLNCRLINARSLVNKIPELHCLLYNCSLKIDVLFVTESWLNNSVSDGILDPRNHYSIYRHDRPNLRGGGVCVFVKRGLRINQLSTSDCINPVIDIIGLDIFLSEKLTYRFFLTYRPPNSSPIYSLINSDVYLHSMLNFITSNFNPVGPTLVLGDLNSPLINWKINKPLCNGIETRLIDFVNENGMTQCVDKPTHDSHILDIVLLNDPLILSSLFITDPFSASDHCSIAFSLSIDINQCINVQRKFYDWQKADWSGFNDYICQIDWLSILTVNLTVDSLWEAFCHILNLGIDQFVPCHTKNSNLTKSKKKYPKNIRQLLSNKSKTWRAMKANPNSTNLIAKYKTLTTKLKDAMRSHEIEEETKIINSDNIGTFYKYVNRQLSHPSGIGVLYDNYNQPIIADNKKADLLNSYFESVYVDDNGILPQCNSRVNDGVKLDDVTFSPETIYHTIRNLKPKITCDPEGYPRY